MLTLETIKKDTIWVAKMSGWRESGTYEEIGHLAESDECRDFDVAAIPNQPEYLRDFWRALFNYERDHDFQTIDSFYPVWEGRFEK